MRQKKRPKINGPFVPIMKEMISSSAFLNLTNASEEVKFPYSDAEKFMHKHTFADSIRQLEENGFIEKTEMGGLFRKTNIYSFTERWRQKK